MTDRDETIRTIRSELRRRSGKPWSVTGGRGTSWGWITITAPPARRDRGSMNGVDRHDLSALLGVEVHHQGVMIPASSAHYREYVARAQGDTMISPTPAYWD